MTSAGSTCSDWAAGRSSLPGVQFSRDPEALNQYFRQMVPDTGPFDAKVVTDAVSALFDKIGPGVLVTHSHSGGLGWTVAMKNPNVRAIVSYEPGSGFVFPEGEVPPPMPSLTGALEGIAVSKEEFAKLTRIPIVVYYGDNIPMEPSNELRRRQLARASGDGQAVDRGHQPTRRRCDAGAPAGDRHPRQHALSRSPTSTTCRLPT